MSLNYGRASSSGISTHVGSNGEIGVNTTTNTIHIFNGSTPGGIALAKYSDAGFASTSGIATVAQGLTGVPSITVNKIIAGLTSSIIPFYWDNYTSLPSYSTYHGAVAHAHDTGKLYYAHTRWVELVNTEADGTIGTGTERYNIGITSVTTLNVSGVSTFAGITTITGTTLFAKQLNVSGVVTASSFSGSASNLTDIPAGQLTGTLPALNGSALTNLIGVGAGVIIEDSGTLVGTAGTIDFGDNLTVSSLSAGIVTITASGGGSIVGINTTGTSTFNNLNVTGVITGTTFIGAVTGNATGLSGTPNITVGTIGATSLNASGVVTASSFTGAGTGLTSIPAAQLTGVLPALDGSALQNITASGTGIVIKEEGTTVGTAGTINFVGSGVTATFSAGIATISITTSGGGSSIAGIDTAGTSTFNNLNVTGVTTSTGGFVGNVTGNATGLSGTPNITVGTIGATSLNASGVVTATSFSGSGINLTGIVTSIASGSGISIDQSTGKVTITATGGSGSIAGIDTTGTSTFTNLNVTGISTFAGITTVTGTTLFAKQISNSGITTATSFRSTTTVGDGTDIGFALKYYITSSGSSAYRLAGPGVLNSTDNPTLYLHRGFTYIFENSTGGSHPFAIRTSSGGSAYTSSFLSGSQSGTQIFTVPFDAPNTLVYQCTIHSGMVGTLNIVT